MRPGTTDLPNRVSRWLATALLALGTGLAWSAVAWAADGTYYLADERLGTRTAPLLLLSRADVRADLGLSAEQTAAALQAIDELYTRAEAMRGQPDSPQVIAARRAIDQDQTDWISTQLSLEQQSRLLQIELQWEGPAALVTRPVVAESLELSEDQRRVLSEALAGLRRERAQGHAQPEGERALAAAALETLTEAQRERWKVLLGRPFVIRPDARLDPAVGQALHR